MSAPERIWTASTDGKCHVGFDTPSINYTNEYIRKDASDAAIAAARAEGVREGMLKAADRLGSMAAQTPLGNESRERGSSTYNWLRYCEKWVRNFAAEAQP